MSHSRLLLVLLLLAVMAGFLLPSDARAQLPGSTQANSALRGTRDNRSSQERPADVPTIPPADRRAQEENEKQMKKDVDRLCQLATALKEEVDRTDTNNVLSATLGKKAKEIEKLAKDIKSRAKS